MHPLNVAVVNLGDGIRSYRDREVEPLSFNVRRMGRKLCPSKLCWLLENANDFLEIMEEMRYVRFFHLMKYRFVLSLNNRRNHVARVIFGILVTLRRFRRSV